MSTNEKTIGQIRGAIVFHITNTCKSMSVLQTGITGYIAKKGGENGLYVLTIVANECALADVTIPEKTLSIHEPIDYDNLIDIAAHAIFENETLRYKFDGYTTEKPAGKYEWLD